MSRILTVIAVLAGLIGPAWAQNPVVPPVWVNLRSGVYHCAGTEYYGRTARGEYLPEAEARARGHRPNGGRPCPPTGRAASARTPGDLDDTGPVMPGDSLSDCRVARIVDGDTIECREQGPVRPIGFDAPEGDQEPYGTAATAALAALLPAGATVQLTLDVETRDRNGRLLAHVWHEGRSVGWLMVRHGWAVALHVPPNGRYAEWMKEAERRATEEGRGLWRVDGFRCRPADRRARRC